MAKRYSGYSKEELLKHLKYNGDQANEFMRPKLAHFREVDKLFSNISKKDDGQVRMKLLRAVVLTRLSLSYIDRLTNQRGGRTFRDNDQAMTTQALYEFDFEETDMDVLKYMVDLNTELYGVGCFVANGWDAQGMNPTYKYIPTKALRPDPNGNIHSGFQYIHFHGTLHRSQITKENGYMNTYLLDRHYAESLEKKQEQQIYQQTRNLGFSRPGTSEYIVPVQYAFEQLGGKKYFIVTAGNYDVPIKMMEIAPVRDEEKQNLGKIEYPVFMQYNTILEGDPCGESTADVIGDKQRAMNLLQNLNLLKAKDSALGKYILFNEKVIDDVSKITKRKTGPSYIPYDPDELGNLSPNDVIVEVQDRPIVTADAQHAPQILKQIAYEDIGTDAQGMGVAGDGNKTATENQRVQTNANIRHILHARIRGLCWKKFAWQWLRSYHENFDYSSKKNIALNKSYGKVQYTVTKDDIPMRKDVDMKIVSSADKEIEDKRMRESATIARPMIIGNPMISQYAQVIFMRWFIKVRGISQEQVMGRLHLTKEERKLEDDLKLLNEDKLPELPSLTDDLMTYRLGYEKAFDTPSKIIAIERIDSMIEEQGVQNTSAQDQQALAQAVSGQANIVANAELNPSEQQAQSLASVAPGI